jgi:hypothetical protein
VNRFKRSNAARVSQRDGEFTQEGRDPGCRQGIRLELQRRKGDLDPKLPDSNDAQPHGPGPIKLASAFDAKPLPCDLVHKRSANVQRAGNLSPGDKFLDRESHGDGLKTTT